MASSRRSLAFFLLLLSAALPAFANNPATTTTLAVSGTSIASGTVLTLTATVTDAASTALTVGQVKFCDADASTCLDAHLLGTAQITGGGTAVLRFVPGIGVHHYKAVYTGAPRYTTSTSSTSAVTVSGTHASTTALTTTGTSGNYTLHAAIAGASSTASPTGSVAFADTTRGSVSLGTAPLVAGASSLSWLSSSITGPGTGSLGQPFVFGDFNGDGKQDIVFANATGLITVMLGNGDGTFTAGPVSTIANLYTIAAGDLNGDGKLDLVAETNSPFQAQIYLGNGDGTFTAGSTVSAGTAPTAFAIADYNNDGIPDLAIACSHASLVVALGNGDGTFTPATGALTSPLHEGLVLAADFNGDGKMDLAVTDTENYAVDIFMGNGDGSFTVGPVFAQAGAFTAVGDFNGDGRADFVLTQPYSGPGGITIELGNADGTFTAVNSSLAGYHPQAFAVGDFNLDGKLDIASSTQDSPNTMVVLLGNGDGTFTTTAGVNSGTFPETVAAVDLTGDGIPDVLVQNINAASTLLLTQLSTSAAATLSNVALNGTGAHSLTAAYAGDTNYAASTSSTASVTVQPLATTLTLTANPVTATFGQQVALTATLTPYSAQTMTTNGESITFSSGGVPLGTAALNVGVATLNVTSLPVGTANLTASYAGDTNFAASASSALSFPVTAIAPTITFAVAGKTYGSAPFAVSATSNSTAAITYTVVSGPATISGGMVTLTGAGSVTLAASQVASGNYTAGSQQATFVVGKAAAGVALASSVNPVLVQNSVALSATVTATAGSPTGTVTFLDGSTALGTGTISGGSATTSLTTLAVGSHSITAVYSGDANFAGGTSNVVAETVQDLTLGLGSGGSSSQTVSAGGTATFNLTLTPSGGTTFPAALTLTASGLPAGATATFNPATIAAGSGTANVTLTIQTVKTTAMLGMIGGVTVAMLALPFSLRKRRVVRLACAAMLMLGASVAMTGCGSSTVSSQPQSYTVTITAASGSLSRTTTVTLTVQ